MTNKQEEKMNAENSVKRRMNFRKLLLPLLKLMLLDLFYVNVTEHNRTCSLLVVRRVPWYIL